MTDSPLVTKYKCLKDETQTFFEWNDLAEPIINSMGIDMWDTIQILKDREVKKRYENGPNVVTYIEDGTFSQQIEESGLIDELVKMVVADLDSQGFLKKNKSLDKFNYENNYYKELIEEKLSDGMMMYLEED